MSEFKLRKSNIEIKKLDNQIEPKDVPIPINSFVWIISGKKGTGKSTIILNLLNEKYKNGGLKKRFEKIYMVSPTSEIDPKFSKLIKELKTNNRYFNEANNKNLIEIFEDIKSDDDSVNKLLIMDDCACDLPKSTQNSVLNKMVILSRHYKLSIIITSQKYNKINPLIRSNADVISFFRTDNKKEFKTLIDDVNTDEDKFKLMYDFATDKNNFIHINMSTNPITFYKNFDKILL